MLGCVCEGLADLALRTKDVGCGLDCAEVNIFMVKVKIEAQQVKLVSMTILFIGRPNFGGENN